MRYAIVLLEGHQGFIVQPAWRARRKAKLLVGSLGECREWIAGYKRAMTESALTATIPFTIIENSPHSDAA